MKEFTHPETGVVYKGHFMGFAVFSDRKTEHNPMNYSQLICYHPDYEVAKAIFDAEVELQKSDDFQEEAKSVTLINRTNIYVMGEGLIVHKWCNY